MNSPLPQQERHPGTRGLVGSRAVQDNVPIAGNFVVALLQMFRGKVEGAWNGLRLCAEFSGMAQVNNDDMLAGVHLLFQLIRGQAGYPQLAQKTLTVDVLP
jgi:hypothetical protein